MTYIPRRDITDLIPNKFEAIRVLALECRRLNDEMRAREDGEFEGKLTTLAVSQMLEGKVSYYDAKERREQERSEAMLSAAEGLLDIAEPMIEPDFEVPAVETAPIEGEAAADESAPADKAPAGEAVAVEEPAPADEVAPVIETAPAQESAPAEEPAPVEDLAPAEEPLAAAVADEAEAASEEVRSEDPVIEEAPAPETPAEEAVAEAAEEDPLKESPGV